jgi:hypothetical protein
VLHDSLGKKKSPPLTVVLVKKIISWFKDVKNTTLGMWFNSKNKSFNVELT